MNFGLGADDKYMLDIKAGMTAKLRTRGGVSFIMDVNFVEGLRLRLVWIKNGLSLDP